MAFLLILDREHKVLWVKTKNQSADNSWVLPEVDDIINKPSNRLNVELLAKQAFIPLKSSLVGQKMIFDIFRNEQLLYLFLCFGKESSEVLFDLTKYSNIQWLPVNHIDKSKNFSNVTGKSIVDAYYDIFLNGFDSNNNRLYIAKNGYVKKDVENYNQWTLESSPRLLLELEDQYKMNRQPLPKIGDHVLLNSWKGFPVAILEVIGVTLERFEKIKKSVEKNDDKDIDISKEVFEQFRKHFIKWCKKNNKQFSDSKSVIISEFEIIKIFNDKKADHLDLS